MSTNALYKGFAGYSATIKKSGTSTAVTGGGMTQVGATSTWEATSSANNMWDRNVTVTVYNDAVDVTSDVESIDYLWGRVTFTSGSEPAGVVTADFNYLPSSAYGVAREFTLTQNAETVDTTDLDTAQGNGGFRTFDASTRDVSLSLSGFYNLSNGFKTLLEGRDELIIEINPSGSSTESACRGFFKPVSTNQSGDFGGAEDEGVEFQLSVPDSDITPFSWVHPSTTTIPTAIQKAITAWQDELTYKYKYLDNGVAGQSGDGLITDISLSSGLSAMSEFSVSIQGTGTRTTV